MCDGQEMQSVDLLLPVEGVQRSEEAYAVCSVNVPVDLPASHDRQVDSELAPVTVEYFATGHDMHSSVDTSEYLPGAQFVHDEAPDDDSLLV
jgi:hypothetical protein